jgi:hypothetical protein
MLRHLRPLIPGQRPSELLRQAGDRARDAVADCLSAMPGQRIHIENVDTIKVDTCQQLPIEKSPSTDARSWR